MTQKMLNDWLSKYNSIDKQSDKAWERLRKYEDAGEPDRAKAAEKRLDALDNQLDGMLQALQIFGYTITLQNGEYVVVEL